MKKMKRLVALALSVVMVLAMSVVAFAATGDNTSEGTTTGSNTYYTITAPDNGHTYEVYQIFTGDLNPDGKTFSSLKWGKNGKNATEGTDVDESVIKALTAVNSSSDTEKLAVIKTYANLSNPVATVTNENPYKAVAGYYLIKDRESSVPAGDTNTLYIVEVVGNVTISPKSEKPSFEKKIKDTNDTTGKTSGWQDSADYDIGDSVPFQLKGTVAADYANYEKYYFAFHDIEETGLTFNEDSVNVYVENTDSEGNIRTTPLVKDTDYKIVKPGKEKTEQCTFEIIFDNLKDIESVVAGSRIIAEYTSTLNEQAVLGNQGNVNKAKLEFSNNPNDTQGGTPSTGETPWDNVIVFTYKVVVNKVDSNSKPLKGAEFTLSKKVKVTDENGKEKEEERIIAVINGEDKTTFTFKGLDDGEYTLSETKTPDGYNTISPIKFTVTAQHEIEWTSIETRNDVLTSLSGNAASGEITFTPSISDGSLSTNVVNNKGSQLPSTGGIGTTIFYVVGGILMVGAAVLLITKRRAEN